MKPIRLFCLVPIFLLSCNFRILAQDAVKIDLPKTIIVATNNLLTTQNGLPIIKTDPIKKYKRLRNGGIVLTVSGTALIAAGGLLIDKDNRMKKESPNRKDRSANYGLGLGLTILGATGLLSGVPMWIIGDSKFKKAVRNVDLRVSPTSSAIVYKF